LGTDKKAWRDTCISGPRVKDLKLKKKNCVKIDSKKEGSL
jgi:hypothetical protein